MTTMERRKQECHPVSRPQGRGLAGYEAADSRYEPRSYAPGETREICGLGGQSPAMVARGAILSGDDIVGESCSERGSVER